MRLEILEDGHRRRARIALSLVRRLTGKKPDEVAMTSLYRPEFFGRPWLALLREVMRGPSPWSPGERELLAAFVSRLNHCPYCVGVHTGTATLGLDTPATVDMLDHRQQQGGFSPKLRAIFALLERVVANPGAVAVGDVEAARAAEAVAARRSKPVAADNAARHPSGDLQLSTHDQISRTHRTRSSAIVPPSFGRAGSRCPLTGVPATASSSSG